MKKTIFALFAALAVGAFQVGYLFFAYGLAAFSVDDPNAPIGPRAVFLILVGLGLLPSLIYLISLRRFNFSRGSTINLFLIANVGYILAFAYIFFFGTPYY